MNNERRQRTTVELNGLACRGKTEPIGYALFNEARKNSEVSPRAALVIGIAALETSLKQCIARLFPATEWILMNLQSPNIVSILNEYWLKMPAKPMLDGKPLIFPPSLINTIRLGVQMRNNIVHGHEQKIKSAELHEVLLTVHDLMRIFDAVCGEHWSLDYVRASTLSQLRG